MKRLVAIALLLTLLTPLSVFSAYGLTQSADLESGSSQHFTRADNATLSITGDMTIRAWIKFESIPTDAFVIVGKSATTGNNRSYLFAYDGTGGFYSGASRLLLFTDETGAGSGGAAQYTQAYVSWTPSTGVWYHVAATYDSAGNGTIELYIDGVAQTETYDNQTGGAIFDSTADFYIGADQRTGTPVNYFDGRISLVQISATTETAGTIAAEMCSVLGTGAGEWTLDNTLNDNSGNGFTLTNVNSVTFGADVPSVCATAEPEQPKDLLIKTGNIIINNGNFIIR